MKNIKIMQYLSDNDARLNRESSTTGFIEDVRWVPSAYGSPSILREYLCSNGDGKPYRLWCTGGNKTASFIVELFLSDRHYDEVNIYWNGKTTAKDEIGLQELKALSQSYNVWYSIEEYDCGDCDLVTNYYIEEPPKYWLQNNPVGPIDDEIDQYEVEVTNDLDVAHRSDFKKSELIKQEEMEIEEFAWKVVDECTKGRRFREELPPEKVANVIFQAMRKEGLV